MEIDMSFEIDYNALKARATDRVTEIVLDAAASPKTAAVISVIDAGMLVLMDRLSHKDFNDLWAQIEDAGYMAGDEPSAEMDTTDFNYVGSPAHY
jgi:hypothetical protein